jgi:protocatechuate 3,4-dioxygenase, beta subunit
MSDRRRLVSRREMLWRGLAIGSFALVNPLSSMYAQEQKLRQTPNMVMGPFYPLSKPLDQDADLTMVSGRPGRAQGKVVHLVGRVLNRNGDPVQGAKVEIWQANSHGRYAHPSDPYTAPLDPNFQGFGVQLTDSHGLFRFKTVKPGPYPSLEGTWMRAPHIHFDVSGKRDRKVTQMFFEGEPLNDQDLLFRAIRANKEGVVSRTSPPTKDLDVDSLIVTWDIVLLQG